MKRILSLILALVLALSLSACVTHEHTPVIDPAESPTCALSGKTEGSHCADCGAVIKKQYDIEPLPHDFVETKEIPATCSMSGSTSGEKCSRCGFIKKAILPIDPIPHDWIDATETTPKTCRECGVTSGGVLSPTTPTPTPDPSQILDPNGEYHDIESVVLYLHLYGKLPSNYITKDQAEALGWRGGGVGRYKANGAIGGDYFGNREGRLPSGTSYTEADIDTYGGSRGLKRIVFSSNGRYYYSTDHYTSFTELSVNSNNEVVWH